MRYSIISLIALLFAAPATAQTSASAGSALTGNQLGGESPVLPVANPAGPLGKPKPGYNFFGSFRLRVEDYNWYPTDKANGAYTFGGGLARGGFLRQTSRDDEFLELALPFYINLPTQALATAPQGPLGSGATYRAQNGGRVANIFVKQGFVRFKNQGGKENNIRIGRFEFGDGSETVPADINLAYIKANHINQRLIGAFPYTISMRSLDGIQFVSARPKQHYSAILSFPTRGAFDLNGSDTLLSVDIAYLNAAFPQPGKNSSGEGRLFAVYYGDNRTGTVKVDNRTAAARAADHTSISYATVGGDYLREGRIGAGKADGLFWFAGQSGAWGSLKQGAFAFDTEAGYQFDKIWAKPWFRAGYTYFSGDGSSANGQHGTFIPLIPTGRLYARFPFFTEANLKDFFGQLILQPSKKMTIRLDIHGLKLADNHDLWYSGSGAYDNAAFGYTGKPSNGHNNLGVLYDASIDYQVGKQISLSLYGGYSDGGDVQKAIYKSGSAVFGYAEAQYRF